MDFRGYDENELPGRTTNSFTFSGGGTSSTTLRKISRNLYANGVMLNVLEATVIRIGLRASLQSHLATQNEYAMDETVKYFEANGVRPSLVERFKNSTFSHGEDLGKLVSIYRKYVVSQQAAAAVPEEGPEPEPEALPDAAGWLPSLSDFIPSFGSVDRPEPQETQETPAPAPKEDETRPAEVSADISGSVITSEADLPTFGNQAPAANLLPGQQQNLEVLETQMQDVNEALAKITNLLAQQTSMSADEAQLASEKLASDNDVQLLVSKGLLKWSDLLKRDDTNPEIDWEKLAGVKRRLSATVQGDAASLKGNYRQYQKQRMKPGWTTLKNNTKIWHGARYAATPSHDGFRNPPGPQHGVFLGL